MSEHALAAAISAALFSLVLCCFMTGAILHQFWTWVFRSISRLFKGGDHA